MKKKSLKDLPSAICEINAIPCVNIFLLVSESITTMASKMKLAYLVFDIINIFVYVVLCLSVTKL